MMRQKLLDLTSNPLRIFLLFSVTFGTLFVFLTPPLQAPDEPAHFYRAYQLSELKLYPASRDVNGTIRYGEYLPKNLHADIMNLKGGVSGHPETVFRIGSYKAAIKDRLNPHEQEFVAFEGSAGYPPVAYIPQSAAIFLGRILRAPPVVLMWLARLANLAVWIICIYFAIKFMPRTKWAITILALNPLAIFLAASLSSDGLTIGLSFLFMAYVIHLKQRDTQLSQKEYAILALLMLLLPFTKITSIILAFFVFILPSRIFRINRILFCGLSIAVSLLITLAWNASVSQVLKQASEVMQPGQGVLASGQVKYIITHPISYAHTIINNYILARAGSGDAVLRSYNGTFGWLDTSIPLWVVFLQLTATLLALVFQMGRGVYFNFKEKLWSLTLLLGGFLATITALYVIYTPVGSTIVSGVQGRYFIPFTILLVPIFTSRKKVLMLDRNQAGLFFSSSTIIVLVMTSLTLFLRYY